MSEVFYKLAKPSGWDFFTGDTVNYREAVGGTVSIPEEDLELPADLCSRSVLHACREPNECFVGAKLPCSVYEVTGKPVADDGDKQGFKTLKVLREISSEELDELFGWRILETMNPVNPFKIEPPAITEEHVQLLKNWDSVLDSVLASVRASVLDSVWHSVWHSVRDSVRASWHSVWHSVRHSVWAYIGSLFPNIIEWKYVEHPEGEYPFQATADLWRMGLVPSFNGETWRLHGGPNAQVLYEWKKEA